jgi:tetratricopeptide (TPR) repeat protein
MAQRASGQIWKHRVVFCVWGRHDDRAGTGFIEHDALDKRQTIGVPDYDQTIRLDP